MDEHKNMRPLAMDEDDYLRRELTSEEPADKAMIPPEVIEAVCETLDRLGRAMTSATDAFCKAMAEGEKVQTNADWIRSLSDEALCHVITNAGCASDLLDDYFPDTACTGECSACMLRWLREEHKEEDNGDEGI
jgi:hypothetical protein